MNVARIREDFPVTADVVYLNVANHAPPSVPVREAIRGFLADWDGLRRRGDERVEEAVGSFARLIGADPDEVACQPNTSAGLTAVAEAVGLERGMNVVVNDLENPANVYPWTAQRRRGVEVRVVKGVDGAVRAEDIEAAVDDDTRVVAVSHVQWMTGARSDLRRLAEVAHDHGAYLVVDGIQSAGALVVDVKRDDVDFFACGSYKWLLGPSGAGFLYVRGELVEALRPGVFGYRAVEQHSLGEPQLKASAKRFELGEPSYLSFVGTKAGIDTILRLGKRRVEERVLKLSRLLLDGLLEAGVEVVSPTARELRSGIVSFRTRDTEGLYKSLRDRGFVVSLRPARIRVSPDFYNTEEELERFIECVGDALR